MAADAAPAVAAEPVRPANPLVASLLSSRPAQTTPVTPIASAPSGRPGLSMHPEAIRARERRRARSGRPGQPEQEQFTRPQPAATSRLTPELHASTPDAMPAPSQEPTPEQRAKALKNIAMVIRGAGWVAAAVFKSDEMKVSEKDASGTAEAVLDGYPELALEPDADLKKLWAWAAVGSLALERYTAHRNRSQARALPASSPTPDRAAADLPAETFMGISS